MTDGTTTWARTAGWACGVALIVAAGLALAYAVAVRATGTSVLLLGARWGEGRATDVLLSFLVAVLAIVAGLTMALRWRSAEAPKKRWGWRWLLAAAVLVIPMGAVLEVIAAILRAVLGAGGT